MDHSELFQTDLIYKRVGHITVPYRHYIIVWGGFGEKVGSVSGYCSSEQLWFYNCLTDVWTLKKTVGEVPSGTSGSTAVVHDDELYIFSGIEEVGDDLWTYSNKLYRLDLSSLTWTKLVGTGRQPQPCDKSVGWYYKQRLYFFGGYGTRPREPPYDFHYVIDNSDSGRVWNNQFICFDLATNSWIKPKEHGYRPSPRAAHSADVAGCLVYIFGGRIGEMRNNELFCLDMKTFTWSHNLTHSTTMNTSVPAGRSWHTFNFVSPNRAVLYGGLLKYGMPAMDCWECSIDSGQNVKWYQRKTTEPLCWHQAAYCAATGDLAIVGGVTTSPYEMREEDHVDSMIMIHYQPKSLFRLSMDVILENDLLNLSPKLVENYIPETLLQLLRKRASQKRNPFEEF
ncbi:kelch domain-containing protein 2-like isoform X2 [Rhodnius prolixus]|uniref:kelch domain-containing protein 2-like isoform X2 n=1 Tax=Rhodnius prolixus TaxID=13249 RepID=UPI003D18E61D